MLTLIAILLSIDFIDNDNESFVCNITVTWPGQTDSRNSICDASNSAEHSNAKDIDGANKMKFFLSDLFFKREIFLQALMFDASQPRPQTPSVGWIKILPSFSQLDASAGDENSLKLITGLTHLRPKHHRAF